MQRQYSTARNPREIVTVTGQGVSLRVRRHHLEITDGFPLEAPQETRRVSRAVKRVQRVLLLAGSGVVTVDALDWCAENGVPLVAVSQSGEARWTVLPGSGGAHQAALRRAQALAPFTEVGADIARWLILRKISGQRNVLQDLAERLRQLQQPGWSGVVPSSAAKKLDALLLRLEQVHSTAAARQIEAEAAGVYWSGWKGLPLHFAPLSYRRRVPDHWSRFQDRGSPLNTGNRNAVDPANALLSYAYALLEGEARIACHEAGLDPSLGIVHTDTDGRRSLLYDIMEPVRPVADRLILTLLLSHAFRPGELHLLRDGRCRLDQDLCARLWAWMPEFRQALGPIMTFLLGRLRGGPRYGERRAYRLVEIAPPQKTRVPFGQKRWARDEPLPSIAAVAACRSCGVLLEEQRRDRLYCDSCVARSRRRDLDAGREVLNELRREGSDPAHGGRAARRRASTQRRQARARARWHDALDSRTDSAVFRREILPRLRRVSLSRIARSLDVSPGYASFIRRGLRVPHPRHWETLKILCQPSAFRATGS